MDSEPYGEPYFEGRNSNYWWTVGSYDNLAKFPHWNEIVKFIRLFKDGGRLLDIGCAYGLLVNAASTHFESSGVDISWFAIEKSKKYCRGSVSRSSAAWLPFRDSCFDVVAMVDTLEHVQHLSRCLTDVARILKRNGVLFLQLPNLLVWKHVCGRLGLEDETHKNNFLLRQWTEILANYGLIVERRLGLVSYAFGKVRVFLKSSRAALFFPELWIIAQKQGVDP